MHIDFLDSEIRLDEEQKRLRLERLSAVDIDSLATLDIFFKPISWYFGLGWRQAAVNGSGAFSDIEHHGVAYIDGGAGYSLQLGDSGQCYLQLGMDIEEAVDLIEDAVQEMTTGECGFRAISDGVMHRMGWSTSLSWNYRGIW